MVALTLSHPEPRASRFPPRRGVLLLVVLSMLTLFLMLGSTYLVVALRARRVSQAFSSSVSRADASAVTGARLVDEVLLTVLRGTNLVNAPTQLKSGDDLLGDRYGSESITGTFSTIQAYQGSPAFLELTTSSVSPQTTVTELAGRVVTVELPGFIASARILRASGSPDKPKLVIAAGPSVAGMEFNLLKLQNRTSSASASQRRLVINGREFDGSGENEPWDGFDSKNPLISQILVSSTGGPPSLSGTASILSGLTLNVDNDSDGVPDSAFQDFGLPPVVGQDGTELHPRAAVLVLDLDGRINLNVHSDQCMLEAIISTGTAAYPRYYDVANETYHWEAEPETNLLPLAALPVGKSTVANTSLAKSDNLRSTLNPQDKSPAPRAKSLEKALDASGRASSGLAATEPGPLPHGRQRLNIGAFSGRFGGGGWNKQLSPTAIDHPGKSSFNDAITAFREQWTVEADTPENAAQKLAKVFFEFPARYGTPPDVKARMRLWADPKTGQPVFYKPFWDQLARNPAAPTWFDNEIVDDPYEIDLTPRGSRIAVNRNLADGQKINNPYTAADLEGLLRYFDSDNPQLSQRLVAISDVVASASRLTITTDSWDTPAITGDAWRTVVHDPNVSLMAASSVTDYFAPETLMGHRLDLNRPFHSTSATEANDAEGRSLRQAMARHLYCLLVSLTHKSRSLAPGSPLPVDDARRIAQYAVNIVDFRDADSTMTLFKYDPAFAPGRTTWDDSDPQAFVWGCERPEVLITETYAYHDRNTDDEAVGGSVRKAPAAPDYDSSFDQKRRPRGAFFVELTSPWAAAALEFDGQNNTLRPVAVPRGSKNPFDHRRGDILAAELVSASEDADNDGQLSFGEDANSNGKVDAGEDANQDGLFNFGEDRNGNGVLDTTPLRNRLLSGIDIEKKNSGGHPVWRLVSVRGDCYDKNGDLGSAFGTDALSDVTTNGTKCLIDPADPQSPAVIDRVFYFAEPPAALKGANVFWQAVPSWTPLTRGHFRVVGTNAPFKSGPGRAPLHVAGMIGPGNKPATLTEPLVTAATDPYEVLMQDIGPNTMTPDTALGGIASSWSSPADVPLDAYGTQQHPFPNTVMSDAFMTSGGQPLLMVNGTHANFAVVHLQRLADPERPFDSDSSQPSSFNPYVTVDSMPVDLHVLNSVNARDPNNPVSNIVALDAGNYDDPIGVTAKEYRLGNGVGLLSVERGGWNNAAPDECDIWSRRVNPAVVDRRDAAAFRTVATDAADLIPPPGPRTVPSPPGHTLEGKITGFRIVKQGSGYSNSSTVTVTGGTGLQADCITDPSDNNKLVAIKVTQGGSGYNNPGDLDVTISDGTGAVVVPIVGGQPTRWDSSKPFASLPWLNRPFESVVELTLVPVASPFHLTQRHAVATSGIPIDQHFFHLAGYWEEQVPTGPWIYNDITGRAVSSTPSFLDFVQVRSRFAGLYPPVASAANVSALQSLGLDKFQTEELSTWREPGRINVNTITDGKGPNGEPRGAWRALFGSVDAREDIDVDDVDVTVLDYLPRWSGNLFLSDPAQSFRDFFRSMPDPLAPVGNESQPPPDRATRQGGYLDDHSDPSTDLHRLTDRNPWARYQTMLNLSERITMRSNVYAVWVTVGYFDSQSSGAAEVVPARRSRGFYIIDRSIPVAYERGNNHNVRDTIRLRRIIQ